MLESSGTIAATAPETIHTPQWATHRTARLFSPGRSLCHSNEMDGYRKCDEAVQGCFTE